MTSPTNTTLACPTCATGTTLVAVERRGVTIDACPRCRGVWLEAGVEPQRARRAIIEGEAELLARQVGVAVRTRAGID